MCKECVIYTDGSFDKKTNTIGWAFSTNCGHEEYGTDAPDGASEYWNIAGECVAVVKALKWANSEGIGDLTIYHDYLGLAKWPTMEWKAKTPLTQWYRDQVNISGISITWNHVRGHTGIEGNERVDKLAYKAATGKDKK